MIEALLEILHPRWLARLEVPVYRPARGVIDLVLQSCHTYNVEAVKVESYVREELGTNYLKVVTDFSQQDLGQLKKVVGKIEKVKGVTRVERMRTLAEKGKTAS